MLEIAASCGSVQACVVLLVEPPADFCFRPHYYGSCVVSVQFVISNSNLLYLRFRMIVKWVKI